MCPGPTVHRRYTAHEFDSEFIEALREACFRYIENQGDATLAEVATFIQSRGFSKVDLRQDDVLSIVNTLVYDGRVETVDDEEDVEHFRPAMLAIPKQSAFTSMPCGVCPVSGNVPCVPRNPMLGMVCTSHSKPRGRS